MSGVQDALRRQWEAARDDLRTTIAALPLSAAERRRMLLLIDAYQATLAAWLLSASACVRHRPSGQSRSQR